MFKPQLKSFQWDPTMEKQKQPQSRSSRNFMKPIRQWKEKAIPASLAQFIENRQGWTIHCLTRKTVPTKRMVGVVGKYSMSAKCGTITIWVKSGYWNVMLIRPHISLAEMRKGTQHLCLTQRLGSQHRSPGTALQMIASKGSFNEQLMGFLANHQFV